jgi:nicotinamide phosphoribosyltransferase
MSIQNSIILNTDSYKASHFKQYPPGTLTVSSYIESRGGKYKKTLFFGLQAFLKDVLCKRVTETDVRTAKEVYELHGVPFNYDGWMHIVQKHDGYLPLMVEALPEGTVCESGIPLVQVHNTDPYVPWLTSWVETALLRAVWYPTTVATQSWYLNRLIGKYLDDTSATGRDSLPFKLHDFGARGASSHETAALGGMAHLINFQGTDTVAGLMAAREYYMENMAGFSIPASEHSTITAWKREGESEAYRNMIAQFGGEGKVYAVVSDSYDIANAVKNLWGGQLREQVVAAGGTLVIRPDSGDPIVIVPQIVEQLAKDFGFTTNSKGFKVLHPSVRVIQGDGVHPGSIRMILDALMSRGFSADNIAFGMGGALLQQMTRDTLDFAMKASAIENETGGWYDVYKDPITQSSKRSKRGVLAVVNDGGKLISIRADEFPMYAVNELRPVFRDGALLINDTFASIRARAASAPD